MSNDDVIACHSLVKEFTEGPSAVSVLKGIDLAIQQGKRVALVGASGSETHT
ncbi:MAG: hypothetical protein HUJ30_01055 [Gammaproteobacteria bacterium]|nr:hypothetical protein [Gammaproteobacteria bacterium]